MSAVEGRKPSNIDDTILKYADSMSPDEISMSLGGVISPAAVAARTQSLLKAKDWLTEAQEDQLVTLRMKELVYGITSNDYKYLDVKLRALIALGDNDPALEDEYRKLGTTAGAYDDWHEGKDPAGITTQDPELMERLDPVKAGRRLANYLKVMTLEAQTIARACGKNHVHNLEPEDLCALTIEAAAMARVPLAGTSWIPGQGF